MTKPMRDTQRALEDAGFTVVEVTVGKHVKWRIHNPANGRSALLVTSYTPSTGCAAKYAVRDAQKLVGGES